MLSRPGRALSMSSGRAGRARSVARAAAYHRFIKVKGNVFGPCQLRTFIDLGRDNCLLFSVKVSIVQLLLLISDCLKLNGYTKFHVFR